MNAPTTSTRPYLIRALYEWCTDNGFTPYLAVAVDETVQVPREYVKDNEIVLNIGFDATSALVLGNEFIEFKARFGGKAREILVPISHVIAIYARENGQGMAFPLESASDDVSDDEGTESDFNPSALSDAEPTESKIMQLVDNAPQADTPSADALDTDPPEPPTPPQRPRPALKRVK